MSTPTSAALEAARTILADLPTIAVFINEVNNLDSESELRARCYQAAVESIAKRIQAAIDETTKTDDAAMLEWMSGLPVHVRINFDGKEVVLKGYWHEDVRFQIKKAMEHFPDSPNHPELPSKSEWAKNRAEAIVSELEELGHLDFDGGEQEDRKRIIAMIARKIQG